MSKILFENGTVVLGEGRVVDRLLIERGRVADASTDAAGAERVDLAGGWLLPGFIDTQVNGGGGVLFNDDPSVATIATIGAAHARFGTTGFLPTLISDTIDKIDRAMRATEQAIADGVEINTTPVGAGPFVLDELVPGSHATLKRNPDHWNAEEILLEELRVVARPAEAVAYAGLTSGQYDLAHIDDSQILPLERAGFRIEGGTCFNVHTIEVNNRHAPFDDPRVVEAFNRAIDRDAIIDSVFFGYGEADWQPFTRDLQGYDPALDRHWDHDVERARALLAEAGLDRISVPIHVYGDAGNDATVKWTEVIQAQVAEAGFDLTIELAPPGSGQKAAHSYTLYAYSFSGRESPVQALEVLYDEGGWMNISGQHPDGFAEALDLVRRTPLDSPDYLVNLQAATRLATTGATPHAWLVNWNRAHALNDRVTGFRHCRHTQRFEGVGVAA